MMILFARNNKKQNQHVKGDGTRIPKALQDVILASNKGKELKDAPPKRMIGKFLRPRTWRIHHTSASTSQSTTSVSARGVTVMAESSELSGATLVPKEISLSSTKSSRKLPIPSLSPQKYLESLLRSRGYSIECHNSASYYNKPNPIQQASYGIHVIDVVRRNDVKGLQALFQVGIHPDACNSFGESLVHLACRYGNYQILETMIDFNCTIQTVDDYGRTPLHDICWTTSPCFKSAKLILQADTGLFLVNDSRGSPPLSYVPKEQWSSWIRFLESSKEEYWPRDKLKQNAASKLTENSKIPDGVNLQLITMVANGKMTCKEAEIIISDDNKGQIDSSWNGGFSSSHDDDDDISLSECDFEFS